MRICISLTLWILATRPSGLSSKLKAPLLGHGMGMWWVISNPIWLFMAVIQVQSPLAIFGKLISSVLPLGRKLTFRPSSHHQPECIIAPASAEQAQHQAWWSSSVVEVPTRFQWTIRGVYASIATVVLTGWKLLHVTISNQHSDINIVQCSWGHYCWLSVVGTTQSENHYHWIFMTQIHQIGIDWITLRDSDILVSWLIIIFTFMEGLIRLCQTYQLIRRYVLTWIKHSTLYLRYLKDWRLRLGRISSVIALGIIISIICWVRVEAVWDPVLPVIPEVRLESRREIWTHIKWKGQYKKWTLSIRHL